MKIKTAEEILEQMRIEMPSHLPERIKPYILEAMKIYAKSVAQKALENAAENAKLEDSIALGENDIIRVKVIDKSSITNPDNIPTI